MNVRMIETDNPMLDNIVYYTKILALGCIVKNEEEADKYESADSIRLFSVYRMCIENTAMFETFYYTREQLLEAGMLDEEVTLYQINQTNIPNKYRQSLLKIAVRDFKNNYIELNNYYRCLYGLPDVDDNGIKIRENIAYVDFNKYIHEMSNDEIQILETKGILDKVRTQYPEKKYLNFLGDKKIDPYLSRITSNFGLLYLPDIKYSDIRNTFKEKYEKNRVYCMSILYKDAFKMNSDYFDNFICVFIKVQTIADMFMELPDFYIRKDFFDLKSVKYMFLSNGIDFFEEIPMKYQLAMIKNLNQLLKFKASKRSMIDICSLFGFNNIELFKYYLLKDRKLDESGEFVFKTKKVENELGEVVEVEDLNENFDLKFIKVPINESVDNYIKDDNNYVSYEEMTNDDEYWTGGLDPSYVRNKILEKEFNIDRTKFVSIDTIYEMDRLSFEMSYFFNIIFDNVYLENKLVLKISSIAPGVTFKLKHAIFYLYLLTYERSNILDSIFDTPTKVLSVNGFNFRADLSKLAVYLKSKHYTFEDLGIQDFTVPTSDILTYNQLIQIYLKNKNVYTHLLQQMKDAQDAEIYNIYEEIFDSLMVTQINDKIFALPDGKIAKTYTEYFEAYEPYIYEHITQIRKLNGKEKENAISDTIMNILLTLEDYIDTTEFSFLFANMPGVSSEIIKGYIYKVLNFYKSYEIQINKINTVYRFDDSLSNRIKCIDTKHIVSQFIQNTTVDLNEITMFKAIMQFTDEMKLEDKIVLGWILDIFDDVILTEELKIYNIFTENEYSRYMFTEKIETESEFALKDYNTFDDMIVISHVDN